MLVVWGVYAMFPTAMVATSNAIPGKSCATKRILVQWLNSVGLGGIICFCSCSRLFNPQLRVVNYHQPTLLHSEAQGILQDVP